ncbi:LOW QUALITY PROTEIN: hypothetical protein M513_09303 [Trichuris suis]|uniref:Integrase catalytic domain-containing protein n=1 Tax=Trichuris suis TaxID=68888 RepID=A0A085LXZ0_9BILA|nr:LOW QUALITY PROTEIN: hypothetical protein M513_09303 [Trichuris suis]
MVKTSTTTARRRHRRCRRRSQSSWILAPRSCSGVLLWNGRRRTHCERSHEIWHVHTPPAGWRRNRNERLRDQFVCGLKDEDLQKRLPAHSELDLNDALREAVAAESASRQAKDIRSANAENAEIPGTHQIRKGTDQRPPKAAGSSVRCSCASCGGEHQRNQCRFRNAICRWCSRKGYIEKVCRSKRAHNGPTDSSGKGTTTKSAAANAVRERPSRSLTDVYEEGSILLATSGKRKKTITTVLLNGAPCHMEVDSRPDFTIVSMDTYRALWQGTGPPIKPRRQKIVDFQRQIVPLVGVCTVNVSYGRVKGHLRLYIAKGRSFLIILDSYSKWLEVLPVVAQYTKILICELRRVFATHGLPGTIVSDNGSPFTSSEFGEFLRRNAIRHARVAPYHPSSSGQAERMIQTAKDALHRMQSGDLSQRLASFLLSQHTLPRVTTGRSPAEMLMNRPLRTRLDRLHPDWSSEQNREIADNAPKTKPRLLDINEPVLDILPGAKLDPSDYYARHRSGLLQSTNDRRKNSTPPC